MFYFNGLKTSLSIVLAAIPLVAAAQAPDTSRFHYPDSTEFDPEDMTVVRAFDIHIESLRGLEQLGIIIQDIDDYVEEDGLNEEQVYFEVSLMLAKAGFDIVPAKDFELYEGLSFLHVYVNTLSTGVTYVYNLGLALSQDVTLQRDPEVSTKGITWRSEEVGVVSTGDAEVIIQSIIQKTQDFIADHAAANGGE